MGQFTPNLGLYIPSAGETNYNDSFASGMINLDLHDHSGGPNKGVPITSSGLANFSVTYKKLAANVADPTTGIGVNASPSLQNQLQILGILRNIFTLASVPGVGFISMNGSTVEARTLQDSLDGAITWTNADGVAGNPLPAFNIAGISPILVPNGGTGLTSTTPFAILAGGTTGTANLQQIAGIGTAAQVLTSSGSGLPTWQSNFVLPTKPCFSGSVNAALIAVTGDGTFYRVNFQAEDFDQASNFIVGNAGSSGFTAPFTAVYMFNYYFLVRLNSSSINQLVVQPFVNGSSVSNLIYLDPGELIISPTNFVGVSASQMLKLTAGDLVYPVLEAAGSGSKNLDIGAGSFFQGVILC